MATKREITEALLFLPAMAALAAVIGGGLYLVILLGGFLLRTWFTLFAVALPEPAAGALAVIFSAFSVYAIVHTIGKHWPPRFLRRR